MKRQYKPMKPATRAHWMAARIKHGAYIKGKEAPEHYIWRSMLSRCYRLTDKSYKRYGGRGIVVCLRWHEYENFVADMGPRPDRLTIDRVNNNGNYEPDNCQWATPSIQQKNKSSTRWYIRNGNVGTLTEWAQRLNISKELAWWRMKTWGTFIKGRRWLELLPKK